MRQLIAGNWKMNGLRADLAEIEAIAAAPLLDTVDVLVCPPFTLLGEAVARANGRIAIGAQDCHAQPKGAFTGSVAAGMLADLGARHVIVGHSERRAGAGERDADVRAKAEAALAAGLLPIVCVGETQDERDAGRAGAVVARQLAGSLPATGDLVVAYEPVWAIGTGRTATLDEVAEMHGLIRRQVGPGTRILYGGSVTDENARALLGVAEVDGALVGGASLTAAKFLRIIASARGSD